VAAFRHGAFTLETLVPRRAHQWAEWQRQGPDATTALGASEVSLLELATAYRTIASGVLVQPVVIRQIVRDSGEVVGEHEHHNLPVSMADGALLLIQEGLRGVVRIPAGTAHALDSRGFPIAAMGKTGTTNEFRDALFVGSTYGADGITVAVRIGFDDNRSLGAKETGGRVALPVFQELMLGTGSRMSRMEGCPRPRTGLEDRAVSAIDPIVLLHLRDDLRIGQLVGGFDADNTLRERLGAAETLLELQLGLTRPEDQKSLRLSKLTDDLVVVPVKVLAVAFLVFLLASAVLRAVCRRVPGPI
jgi:membrane peptidoglycan carboxypeptidase